MVNQGEKRPWILFTGLRERKNVKPFLGIFVFLKGFLFFFLSFSFFSFFLSLLNPDEDLGVARPSIAFLFLSIFASHLLLSANTEKDACNLELYKRA